MNVSFKRLISTAILAAIALTGTGIAAEEARPPNRNFTIVAENGGHVIGNPAAKVKLTEWVSYTCPHCAHFARDGDSALTLIYLPSGKVKTEIRHIVRDPIDLTVAMLTNCAPTPKFRDLHTLFMTRQDDWLSKARGASETQMQRWSTGPVPARLRAIAADFGFYEMMEVKGFQRVWVDKCLANEAQVKALVGNTRADSTAYAITGTPSFAINGKLLDNVHDWNSLRPLLDAAVK